MSTSLYFHKETRRINSNRFQDWLLIVLKDQSLIKQLDNVGIMGYTNDRLGMKQSFDDDHGILTMLDINT